jgi:hypothetical protein
VKIACTSGRTMASKMKATIRPFLWFLSIQLPMSRERGERNKASGRKSAVRATERPVPLRTTELVTRWWDNAAGCSR